MLVNVAICDISLIFRMSPILNFTFHDKLSATVELQVIAAGHKLYHQWLVTSSALDGVQVDASTPASNYLQD